MASITLERVGKVYPNGHVAARNVDLQVADGELLVLVGASGSGKSTALRIIAGLESPSSGRVLIDGQDVTGVPPQARDLAMVFQSYALYPHKTVRENLAFGLRMRKLPSGEIADRVVRAASALGIADLLDRRPAQLSGGQRQRVALGRAIVREPRAFLFDEPLSNLDPKLRVQTRAELALLHRRSRATMVYVTHDQEEAMTLGDRIAVMGEGRVQQVAPPVEVYRRPANAFVAGFIGSPAMNLVRCDVEPRGDRRLARCAALAIEVSGVPADGRAILLGIRPPDVEIVAAGAGDVDGDVQVVELLGSQALVHVRVEGLPESLRVVATAEADVRVDEHVGVRFRRDRLHLFDAATGNRVG
jgi:ABC-type sugar transport system ATPase subunit